MKAAAKRVYKHVGIKQLAEAGPAHFGGRLFAVTLDDRELRTPARKVLALPTQELACGVALEWAAQDQHIRPETMPLMKLATTAVDQVPSIRPTMVDSMLRCLDSDAACFRSSEEPALMAKEEAAYGPLLAWAADALELRLAVTDHMVLSHPAEALPRAEALLADADDWELTALDAASGTTKSLVIALALSKFHIGAEEACRVARVAEQHQIDTWGFVEAGHDLDAADLAVRVGACSAFLRMLGK